MRARQQRGGLADELRHELPQRELRGVVPERVIQQRVDVQQTLEQHVGEGEKRVAERDGQDVGGHRDAPLGDSKHVRIGLSRLQRETIARNPRRRNARRLRGDVHFYGVQPGVQYEPEPRRQHEEVHVHDERHQVDVRVRELRHEVGGDPSRGLPRVREFRDRRPLRGGRAHAPRRARLQQRVRPAQHGGEAGQTRGARGTQRLPLLGGHKAQRHAVVAVQVRDMLGEDVGVVREHSGGRDGSGCARAVRAITRFGSEPR